MKIPQDQRYWDLCAAICLINTAIEHLQIDIKQISKLSKIEQALSEAKNFDLKIDSIKKLWNTIDVKNKNEIWDWLYNILFDCSLWNIFFYILARKHYINTMSYSDFGSERNTKNKLTYLLEIESRDQPETLIEKDSQKFLLVSAFSPTQKIMYYFKKNSWFVLGNREEKMLTFRPGMLLLYIKIQDNSIIEDINYAKQLLILDSKNCYGEDTIYYIERLSNFLKEEINTSSHQIIKSQPKTIEELTDENKTLRGSLNDASSEIVQLKNEISALKHQLFENERNDKEKEIADKTLNDQLSDLKENYKQVSAKNEQLTRENNKLWKFKQIIRQACDQSDADTVAATDNPISESLSISRHQSGQQYTSSIYSNSYFIGQENSIFSDVKVGIPNIGNTCYLNSVLQIFASNNKLYQIITSRRDNLSIALSKVLSIIRMGNWDSLSLNSLKSAIDAEFPIFLNHEQQDSKELLVALLGFILDERTKSLFSFRYHEIFPCRNCKEKSSMIREESMVIIPSSAANISNFFNNIKEPKTVQGQGMKCDHCGKNSIFKTEIGEIEYPPYSIFYLADSERRKGIDKLLQESLQLNGQRYFLYGVICYYGRGNRGHYTAFTRSKDGWVEYNDHIAKLKDLDRNAAYLAFYSLYS